jgi:hypothetical protein
VIRLHEGDRSEIEKQTKEQWNEVVAAKDEVLKRARWMVNEPRDKNFPIFLNINNEYEGSAPLTIERRGFVICVFSI